MSPLQAPGNTNDSLCSHTNNSPKKFRYYSVMEWEVAIVHARCVLQHRLCHKRLYKEWNEKNTKFTCTNKIWQMMQWVWITQVLVTLKRWCFSIQRFRTSVQGVTSYFWNIFQDSVYCLCIYSCCITSPRLALKGYRSYTSSYSNQVGNPYRLNMACLRLVSRRVAHRSKTLQERTG